jgi:cytochrome c peroxidase
MNRSILFGLCTVLLGMSSLAISFAAQPESTYKWPLPSWVPTPVVPADNSMTDAKVELGRHLFYDKRLSANEQMSCAACHHQNLAFTDGRAVATGVNGEVGARSSMSLVNVAYLPVLTWMNPQLTSLEIQALIPIFGEHPVEMGMAGRERALWEMFKSDPTYERLFKRAFPEQANQGEQALYSLSTLTKALASFQRSIVSFNSPYDKYQFGSQPKALSASAKRGESLFFGEKMECYHCHGGLNFTDNVVHSRMPFPEMGFHNTGLYNEDGKGRYPTQNPGIVEFTAEPADQGKFRTPSLRNVSVTAPYMHDGSIQTLAEVIKSHYSTKGRSASESGVANPLRSELIVGFDINEDEIKDLVAFLESLTDSDFLTDPTYSDPWIK